MIIKCTCPWVGWHTELLAVKMFNLGICHYISLCIFHLFIIWGIQIHMSLLFFSHSVMSDSLWPHGPQHTRLPCSSPSPGACSNSCLSGCWCHSTISSSVIPCSSCLQSFPASGSFPVSQFFTSGGQSIGALASASVLPMNIQDWFPLGVWSFYQYWFFQSKNIVYIFVFICLFCLQFLSFNIL